MIPLVYVPSDEDKKKAELACHAIIKSLEGEPVEFKAYVIQILLESFEEVHGLNIRDGMSITNERKKV